MIRRLMLLSINTGVLTATFGIVTMAMVCRYFVHPRSVCRLQSSHLVQYQVNQIPNLSPSHRCVLHHRTDVLEHASRKSQRKTLY